MSGNVPKMDVSWAFLTRFVAYDPRWDVSHAAERSLECCRWCRPKLKPRKAGIGAGERLLELHLGGKTTWFS